MQLIIDARNGDQSAINQIINMYDNLVRSVASQYFLKGGDNEDLLQEGKMGVVSAINSYDSTKGAFPSFVKMCVTRSIMTAVTRGNRGVEIDNSCVVDYDSVGLSDSADPLDIIINHEDECRLIDISNHLLTQTERDVFKMYQEGCRYKYICETLSLSYKAVDGAIQRAKRKQKLRCQEGKL